MMVIKDIFRNPDTIRHLCFLGRKINRIGLIFLITVFVPLFVFPATGSLSGTVTSKATGETMPGVNIHLLGTQIGASTDLDGKYSINYIPEGTYTVVAVFISYKPDTLYNVSIVKNNAKILDIALEDITYTLEGVTVVARRQTDTEISMISTIKQSSLIINGVSAMQISKSQDKDASEVIKRVPGVTIMDDRFVYVRGLAERYNSVWINGTSSPSTESDQRAFSFDVIPSNMIDNLLVYKTPAPELPSDFAGATIQIHTKNVTEENGLEVSYQAGLIGGTTFKDFYQYKGGKTDFLGFDDGTRKLPDNVPSTEEMIILQDFRDGTPQEVIDSRKAELTEIARAFSETSTAQKQTAPIDNKLSVDFSFYKPIKKVKISNITSFQYKIASFSDQTKRATYEVYDTVYDTSVYVYNFTDDVYRKSVQWGGLHNWSFSTKNSVIEFRNLFNQVGTTKTTFRNGIDYYRDADKVQASELAYSSRTLYSGQVSGDHKLAGDKLTVGWIAGYNYGSKMEPDNRRIYTISQRVMGDNDEYEYLPYILDYSSTVNTELNGRIFTETKENIYTLSANAEYKLLVGNWQPSIKTGIYYENKGRDFNIRTFGIAKAVIQSNFNNGILYQPLDSVYADTNYNYINGVKLEENTSPEYSYQASSKLVAAYLGLKIPIVSVFSLYGGIRVEKFDRVLGGFQSKESLDPDIILDTLNIYPSAILTYNITNKSIFRLSYGSTVNRPEYREIAPYAFYDFEQSATVYGNPDLKDSYIQNIDLRYEYYPTPVDFITIGAFYKKFKDPIELNLFPASNGWDFVAVNSISAELKGIELEIRKSFSALNGGTGFTNFIKNMAITFNGAYIDGVVTKDNDYVRDKKRALYGQSPYILNLGLYYQDDIRGWSGSLLYNLMGPRIVIVGTPTIPNVYELSRSLLDFTISRKLGNHTTLKLGAKNLLDAPVIYQQTFKVVLKDQTNEVERKQDIRSYTPGRSYYLTISYRF
jgi:TonB-dependent receptor